MDVQLDNNLLDSPQFEFVDRPPNESRAESAIGRIKPNPAKPRPLESILPSIIVRRGFDRFVCYCARRRVEIDAAHAGAGDLDNMRRDFISSFRRLCAAILHFAEQNRFGMPG